MDSGKLLFDINFQDISPAKMDLFSSYFSALQSFISENLENLNDLDLADYQIIITNIIKLNAGLVIIGDKEDSKEINKVIPKIMKILFKFKKFIDWQGEEYDFNMIKQQISDLIHSQKKFTTSTSMIEESEVVLKSMWNHNDDLTIQKKEKLIKEKQELIDNIENSENILKNLNYSKDLVKISEKLKDYQEFIKYQKSIKDLKDELNRTKSKLNFYIERIKDALSRAVVSKDYKDVYLNLFSFSGQLKIITLNDSWMIYREMGNTLIKEDISKEQISEITSFVQNMKDDIEDYLI